MTDQNIETLNKIIEGGHIKPVYQPIVSLVDGQVFAYEALSRISNSDLNMNIEEMFATADRANKSWELETLCRAKTLECAVNLKEETKLFINVNPNVIHSEHFMEGFTKNKLDEFHILPENVTFEITERTSIAYNSLFHEAVNHYKNQNYGIAIDDVGSGFSGLNVIVDTKPSFIKLDMHLIRNIDKDETKFLMCKALANFCKGAGIKIIAEGIESEEELREVIKLGLDYGQGYFLGLPKESLEQITQDKASLISAYHTKQYSQQIRSSIYPMVENLCKRGCVFSPDEKAYDIYELLNTNPAIREFTIVENGVAIGFMTRADINTALGGRYGFSLHSKKNIDELINKEFLRVNCDMTVEHVSRLAMARSFEILYNPIVVEKDNQYLGIVTIKDLLETCTKIEIDAAMHSSPLTGLPGNLLVEKEIVSRIFSDKPYCITYYDLDNFKAYNDAYGFENGDLMLKLIADTLKHCSTKNEFVGHIGGDDFIVVADYDDGESYCQSVIDYFGKNVISLYCEEDVNRGYIISKNRNGVTENFPISSISIGGVTSKGKNYCNIDDFSKDVALLKKASKKKQGSCYIIT